MLGGATICPWNDSVRVCCCACCCCKLVRRSLILASLSSRSKIRLFRDVVSVVKSEREGERTLPALKNQGGSRSSIGPAATLTLSQREHEKPCQARAQRRIRSWCRGSACTAPCLVLRTSSSIAAARHRVRRAAIAAWRGMETHAGRAGHRGPRLARSATAFALA